MRTTDKSPLLVGGGLGMLPAGLGVGAVCGKVATESMSNFAGC
ncbi:hypothetical protein [Streptomyces sp. NPDC001415]